MRTNAFYPGVLLNKWKQLLIKKGFNQLEIDAFALSFDNMILWGLLKAKDLGKLEKTAKIRSDMVFAQSKRSIERFFELLESGDKNESERPSGNDERGDVSIVAAPINSGAEDVSGSHS